MTFRKYVIKYDYGTLVMFSVTRGNQVYEVVNATKYTLVGAYAERLYEVVFGHLWSLWMQYRHRHELVRMDEAKVSIVCVDVVMIAEILES